MSTIYTYISHAERQRLSARDSDYLRQQLHSRTALNKLLGKSINERLLTELLRVLDRRPIARRKTGQKNSAVRVYKDGKLVRMESNGGHRIS